MLLNHNNAVASPFQSTSPTAYDAPSGTDSSTSTATITANDFLQLLVTELQNQDPTANTDPNEYVDQLVQVNSLQQLISINEDLTPSSTSSSTGDAAGTTATADSAAATGTAGADSSTTPTTSASGPASGSGPTAQEHSAAAENRLHPAPHSGNLSANVDTQSAMAASANRVASSLLPRRQERVTSPGTSAITSGRFSAH